MLKAVIHSIVPTPQERQQFTEKTSSFLRLLNKQLRSAKAILGGSGAKDTWLAGNHDIDIFVVYEPRFAAKTNQLSDLLEPVLQKVFSQQRITRLHGSRDYFQLQYQNCSFEVVPIIKISSAGKALNITDISPLHARWVNSHGKKLKNEIRLAKQFCKAQRLYGAESYIGGFSGYALEILVIHYGSFEKLLKAALNWRAKDVVDTAKHYPKKDALFHLNKSKQQSPLIVIDPVDKQRNAAAALSLEKFLLFKKKAAEFLHGKGMSFFIKQELDHSTLEQQAKRKKQYLVVIDIIPMEGKNDVVGAKLLKVYEFLLERLNPFSVQRSGWEWPEQKNACFYFFLAKNELPQQETRMGPLLSMSDFVAAFKKKYNKTYIKNNRVLADVVVENWKLEDVVEAILQEQYITERVRKILRIVPS